MLCNLPCRIFLFAMNILTGLAGLTLLTFGALMVWGTSTVQGIISSVLKPLLHAIGAGDDTEQITELVARVLTSTSPVGLVLFSFGAGCAILSFIGYCGACCNSKHLLYLYALIVGLLGLGVLIATITYFAMRERIAELVVDLYKQSVNQYVNLHTNDVHSLVVGFIQPKLGCCGVDSPADFINMADSDAVDGEIYSGLAHPIPCCKMDEKYQIVDDTCPRNFTSVNSNINVACRQILKETFIYYMNYAGYGLLLVFLILVILMLFAIMTVRIDKI